MERKREHRSAKLRSTEDYALIGAMDILGTGLEGLREHVKRASQSVVGDSEAAADLAHLLSKIAVVNAELRKAEAAARNAEGDISPQQMLERIRRMPAGERAQFMRTLQHTDADQGKSGLA
jgi:hypothetical protein